MQAVASERNQQCQCRSGFYRTSTSAVAGVVTCGTAEASFDCTSCQPCVLHSTYEPLNADGSSTCTSSTDRTCRPVLDQCSPEALYFEPTTGAPTLTSDRVCADKRTCPLATHWTNILAATNNQHQDRVCIPLTTCDPTNYFENVAMPIRTQSYTGFRARYVKISTVALRGITAHRWRVKKIELLKADRRPAIDPTNWVLAASSQV